MSKLPVVESCHGCGVCCLQVGHPPYFWHQDRGHTVDEYWNSVPDELRKEVIDYVEQLKEPDFGTPCIWYDVESRNCRHHEYRPRVCRDFEVGSIDCIRLRLDQGIV